jgi:hypothetical protein
LPPSSRYPQTPPPHAPDDAKAILSQPQPHCNSRCTCKKLQQFLSITVIEKNVCRAAVKPDPRFISLHIFGISRALVTYENMQSDFLAHSYKSAAIYAENPKTLPIDEDEQKVHPRFRGPQRELSPIIAS